MSDKTQIEIAYATPEKQLILECEIQGRELAVAHRGSHRWVQSFERVRLERADGPAARLREGGVYL